MCELLGMCFSKPIQPSISFIGFRNRGEVNRHGWGVAFYPDASAQVIKEPINAAASRLSNFLKDYQRMRSQIVLAHVRHATVGNHTRKNTHPFERELRGKDYVFAHNGTLKRGFKSGLPLGSFAPIGDTDSEHAFCYLLDRMRGRCAGEWTKEDLRWLHNELKKVNSHGFFNCLFSDGEHLFAYRGFDGKRELHFVSRNPPYGKVKLLDQDFEIDLGKDKGGNTQGFIVATRPLTDEAWVPFSPGHLIVFKGGRIVFSETSGK